MISGRSTGASLIKRQCNALGYLKASFQPLQYETIIIIIIYKYDTLANQILLRLILQVWAIIHNKMCCYQVNISTASSNAALQRLFLMAPGMWKKPYSDSTERLPCH